MKLARKTNGLNCSETGNMCLCMSSTECQVNKCNALQLLVELCSSFFSFCVCDTELACYTQVFKLLKFRKKVHLLFRHHVQEIAFSSTFISQTNRHVGHALNTISINI